MILHGQILHYIIEVWKNFYSADEYYEGEWYAGKRSGWGRIYYSDGSIYYEGEWYNNCCHGNGLGVWKNFYSADEYYEGEWYGGKRSGWGRMYYSDELIYEREWYNDCHHGNSLLRLGEELHFNISSIPKNYDNIFS